MRGSAWILAVCAGLTTGSLAWFAVGREDVPEVASERPVGMETPLPIAIVDALSRPIFAGSTALPPPPVQAASAAPADDVRLIGVSLTPRSRRAILMRGGQVIRLAVGQSESGIRLRALSRTTATIEVDGSERRLALFSGGKSEGAQPPPTAAQSPPSKPVPNDRP